MRSTRPDAEPRGLVQTLSRWIGPHGSALLAAALWLMAGILPVSAQNDASWGATPFTNLFYDSDNWSTQFVPRGTATFGASNTTSLDLNLVLSGWSNSSAYNIGSEVTFNGSTWVAQAGNFNIVPGSDATVWQPLAGAWSSTTVYNVGDEVTLNGVTYAAKAGNFNVTPGADPAVWVPFSGNAVSGFTFAPGAANYVMSLGSGNLTFTGAGIVVNGGSLNLINDTGVLNFVSTSTAGSATITTNSGGHTFFADSASGGTARFILNGSGIVDISQLTNGGMTAGSIEGPGTVRLGANTLTVGGNNLSTTFSGVLQDGGTAGGSGGSLTKVGTGTLTLSGTDTYTGATTVDAGVLNVTGALTSTTNVTVNGGTLNVTGSVSDPTINSGGLLTGTGSVGDTTVNAGGTFTPGLANTPGTSMTVAGNLAFASGALYVVSLDPSTASFAHVTGQATLGGATVDAVFAAGSYVSKRYTILTAGGGVSGTFGAVANTNLPSNFHTSLSYDSNDAYLDLALNFAPPSLPSSGLNGNQQSVANAIIHSFNVNNGIPLVYGALTAAGLSQAAGEPATGAQQTTFSAMTQYMTLLTDNAAGADGGGNSGAGTAAAYAQESDNGTAKHTAREAYAMFTKAPPAALPAPHWRVWAAGFGGSQTTDGNAAAGTGDTTSRIAGTAVGASYFVSPWTVAGFSLAGGGTSFGVSGLGSGRSDLFQAGAYVRHSEGAAYVAAAAAYGWQDITTDRTVTIAGVDQLRAEFRANAYSGRVEGGYRFLAPWGSGVGLTPYAAAQVTTFDLPAYAEAVVAGTPNFALAYGGKHVTDGRSELGLRTDKSFAVPDGVLALRGRLAWAYDADPDRSVAATFQALPGASFVVNGARQANNSALTTAAAEMKWLNGWSAAATFEGEFSDVTRSYAGRGVVRYTW